MISLIRFDLLVYGKPYGDPSQGARISDHSHSSPPFLAAPNGVSPTFLELTAPSLSGIWWNRNHEWFLLPWVLQPLTETHKGAPRPTYVTGSQHPRQSSSLTLEQICLCVQSKGTSGMHLQKRKQADPKLHGANFGDGGGRDYFSD